MSQSSQCVLGHYPKSLAIIGIAFLLSIFLITQSAMAADTGITLKTGVGLQRLKVEVATTPEQREHGLMERSSLAPDSGMLFAYEGQIQPGSAGYWMFHTLIPLDIAFIGNDGVIVATFTMPPCKSETAANCPIYRPQKSYIGALEMPGGYFKQHHIQVGDTLEEGRNLLE